MTVDEHDPRGEPEGAQEAHARESIHEYPLIGTENMSPTDHWPALLNSTVSNDLCPVDDLAERPRAAQRSQNHHRHEDARRFLIPDVWRSIVRGCEWLVRAFRARFNSR